MLSDSTGYWHVQPLPGRPGHIRVWFVAAVVLAPFVPNFVVRLVSRLGLQKAPGRPPAAQQAQTPGPEPSRERQPSPPLAGLQLGEGLGEEGELSAPARGEDRAAAAVAYMYPSRFLELILSALCVFRVPIRFFRFGRSGFRAEIPPTDCLTTA